MAITLGKNASLSLGVLAPVVGVTDVQWSAEVRTIEIEEFGSREVAVYPTGYGETITFTVNDDSSAGTVMAAMKAGTEVTISGGVGGWSMKAVITSVSESDPLDGVCTLSVTARRTRTGTRA